MQGEGTSSDPRISGAVATPELSHMPVADRMAKAICGGFVLLLGEFCEPELPEKCNLQCGGPEQTSTIRKKTG